MIDLTHDELWHRIQSLIDKPFLSLTGRKEYTIVGVNEEKIVWITRDTGRRPNTTEHVPKHPTKREQVFRVYDHLRNSSKNYCFVQPDLDSLIGEPKSRRFDGRFTMAVLSAAAPTRVILCKKGKRFGIMLLR